MPEPFHCNVVTPEAQVIDAQVAYVSIPAYDGQLGVEHLRAPLLAELGYGPLKLTLADGSEQTWYIGGGFAQVKDDVLTLLTDEAVRADDLNRDEAMAELKEANAFVATSEQAQEKKDRDLARARGKLAVAK